MTNKPLVIIAGPTAVGKSALAVELASKINGEIISADSMQVYKGMDIGTAKISAEEMHGIKHYLIDVLEPTENFDVVRFKQMAEDAVREIYSHGKIPIIVGGTGFYIQAVLYDIDFTQEDADLQLRDDLQNIADAQGPEALHEKLKTLDPEAAEKLHPNDVRRVIRAIEYASHTGEMLSKHNDLMRKRTSPYDFAYFVLTDERSEIYDRIDRRVDCMMEAGLESEVRTLLAKGCNENMTSMKGIGYRQLISYFKGENDLEEAVRLIKRDSRHFAKRQLTWFNREVDLCWIDRRIYPDTASQTEQILRELSAKGMS